MKRAACGVALLVAAVTGGPLLGAEARTAQVSFLEGRAQKSRGRGVRSDLRVGAAVLTPVGSRYR